MSDEFDLSDDGKSYVPIDDDTRLLITPRNWQLQKKTVAQSGKDIGKVTWIAFRYYVSLQNAINDIVHIKTAQETFRTAQGLIEANRKVIAEISKAFAPEYTITANDSMVSL